MCFVGARRQRPVTNAAKVREIGAYFFMVSVLPFLFQLRLFYSIENPNIQFFWKLQANFTGGNKRVKKG